MDKQKTQNLQTSMDSIAQFVDKLESSETTLEESLEIFESSVLLIRKAQFDLAQAEQKVQRLTEKNAEDDIQSDAESTVENTQ